MELMDALLGRRSVYDFVPGREVPDDVLQAAVKAACHAPNHKLTEPWRFTIIGPQTRAKVAGVVERTKAASIDAATMPAERVAMLREKAAQAGKEFVALPVVIAVTSALTPGDAFREREDYAASCCAIQNLQLALWGSGVGSQWSTGPATRDAETYALLGIDPAAEEIIGFVKIGWPSGEPGPARRNRIDDALRRCP
ncbi:MAG: nitroreductase [Planctomycetota bacterium]